MKSGTAIRGVLLYVTNYITKPALKTHIIFDTIRYVFQKNLDIITGSESRQQTARTLMTKIVNSLSVKMEHGSPMINMYLLGNPDHYCSHNFENCYWQAFVTTARSSWVTSATGKPLEEAVKLSIVKQGKQIVGISPVMDYIWRPQELESLSLYNWLGNCVREKKGKIRKRTATNSSRPETPQASDDEDEQVAEKTIEHGSLLSFADDHPLAATHGVHWLTHKNKCVPNLIDLQCQDLTRETEIIIAALCSQSLNCGVQVMI